MKRSSEDDDRGSSSSEAETEEFLSGFLHRHSRLVFYIGIGIAALIVVAIVVAVLTDKGQ